MLRLLKTMARRGTRSRGRQAYRVLVAITEPRRMPGPDDRRAYAASTK